MQASVLRRYWWYLLLGLAAFVVGVWGLNEWRQEQIEQGFEGKAKVRVSGAVFASVVGASPGQRAVVSAAVTGTGFTPAPSS